MKVLFDELAHEVAQETILPYKVILRSEANSSSLQECLYKFGNTIVSNPYFSPGLFL